MSEVVPEDILVSTLVQFPEGKTASFLTQVIFPDEPDYGQHEKRVGHVLRSLEAMSAVEQFVVPGVDAPRWRITESFAKAYQSINRGSDMAGPSYKCQQHAISGGAEPTAAPAAHDSKPALSLVCSQPDTASVASPKTLLGQLCQQEISGVIILDLDHNSHRVSDILREVQCDSGLHVYVCVSRGYNSLRPLHPQWHYVALETRGYESEADVRMMVFIGQMLQRNAWVAVKSVRILSKDRIFAPLLCIFEEQGMQAQLL
jgi:hypothetical protein